ncbi:hypothetical protein Dsin_004244 [Dipteronia sinensis]|uniref:Uncharacterized protein n=1 Tax=Dipteronia sinensis TaxID=43782 RepID=A0AAE0B977_9ROSI|nr:hypothetical protein Dsin_004244 [Dipteronia sinensis]
MLRSRWTRDSREIEEALAVFKTTKAKSLQGVESVSEKLLFLSAKKLWRSCHNYLSGRKSCSNQCRFTEEKFCWLFQKSLGCWLDSTIK